eukprot:m.180031 g.180031  ORF g.180031 m.180031 type:complete len:350 (+) comp32000_c0_seq1:460-1509(+)
MDARSHAGTDVGWAGGDNAIVFRVSKLETLNCVDHIERFFQSIENTVDDQSFLHRHDAKVVFLSNPDDETTVFRHVATPSVWPVGCDTGLHEEIVSGHVLEHDVGLDQRVVLVIADKVLVTGCQRVVATAVISVGDENIKRFAHLHLKVDTLLSRHTAREWVRSQVTSDTNAHGQRGESEQHDVELATLWQTFNLGEVPVIDVFGSCCNAVVFVKNFAKKRFEGFVVGWVHCVTSHFRGWVLNSRLGDSHEILLHFRVHRLELFDVKVLGTQVLWMSHFECFDSQNGSLDHTFHRLLFLLFHFGNSNRVKDSRSFFDFQRNRAFFSNSLGFWNPLIILWFGGGCSSRHG